MKRDLIPSDIVSGAIIAAIIIISFLSLLSFADFLRVHWQQGPNNNNNNRQEGRNENDPLARNDANNSDDQEDEKVDETILKLVESRNVARQQKIKDEEQQEEQGNTHVANLIQDDEKSTFEAQAAQGRELAMLRESRRRQNNGADLIVEDGDDHTDDESGIDMPEHRRLAEVDDLYLDLNDRIGEVGDILANQMNPPENNVEPEPREEPFDPMDPALQDDQAVSSNAHIDFIFKIISFSQLFNPFLTSLLACNVGYGNQCCPG